MIPKHFGEQIRKMRIEHGVTQKELAQALSVVNSTISNWETNRRQPSLDELKKIAEYFGETLSIFDYQGTVVSRFEGQSINQSLYRKLKVPQFSIVMSRQDFFGLLTMLCLLYAVRFLPTIWGVVIFLTCFLLGIWIIVWKVFRHQNHRQRSKTLLIPNAYVVFYEPSAPSKRFYFGYLGEYFFLGFLVVGVAVVYPLWLAATGYHPHLFIIGLKALLSLFITYLLARSVHKSRLMHAQAIEYYDVFNDWRCYPLLHHWIVLMGSVVFYAMQWVLFNQMPRGVLADIVGAVLCVNVVLAWLISQQYRQHVEGMQVVVKTENGNRMVVE